MRAKGLEPPRLSTLEPKSSASTNSATPAPVSQVGGSYIIAGGRRKAHGYIRVAPIRNSTLPSGPVIGLCVTPLTVQPGCAPSHASTSATTRAWIS